MRRISGRIASCTALWPREGPAHRRLPCEQIRSPAAGTTASMTVPAARVRINGLGQPRGVYRGRPDAHQRRRVTYSCRSTAGLRRQQRARRQLSHLRVARTVRLHTTGAQEEAGGDAVGCDLGGLANRREMVGPREGQKLRTPIEQHRDRCARALVDDGVHEKRLTVGRHGVLLME